MQMKQYIGCDSGQFGCVSQCYWLIGFISLFVPLCDMATITQRSCMCGLESSRLYADLLGGVLVRQYLGLISKNSKVDTHL